MTEQEKQTLIAKLPRFFKMPKGAPHAGRYAQVIETADDGTMTLFVTGYGKAGNSKPFTYKPHLGSPSDGHR